MLGFVQPRGAVLAMAEPDLAVVAASAGCEELLGRSLDRVLGAVAGELIRPIDPERTLRDVIAHHDPSDPIELVGHTPLEGSLNRTSGLLVLELEPAAPPGFEYRTLRAAERMHAAERAGELAQLAAAEIRALTGFDRITIYRFRADAVEPVAEARAPSSPSGGAQPDRHHELELVERARYTASLEARPVPLLAGPLAPAELDLAGMACRVAPSDRARGAALSIAIDVGGLRWGVIACEHDAPLVVPPRARIAAEYLARLLGSQLHLRDRIGEEARATSLAKDEFLATVSHELRTPLNAMLGWLRLIESEQVAPERRPQAIATITRNAHVLAGLVDEVLDASRIISGKMRLDLQLISPAAVIEAALATVQLAAEAKHIAIEVSIDPVAAPVLADPARLQQVVCNLLVNAVKFTPESGRVTVTLERVASAAQLTVLDTGIGIEREFLPHVFDRFRQGQVAVASTQRGLGLGLAIARHLVELHGGEIRAESEGLGRGATFFVRLPIAAHRPTQVAPPPRPPPMFEPAPQLRGTRVLVVDDEHDASELVHAVLAASGVEVTTASSAAEVLALLPRLRPDVLISDIGMPDVDGYDLIQQVRRLAPDDGGRTPAIAVTAYARGQDRARAFLAGFDVYLAKPIDPAELTALLVNLVGRTGPVPRVDVELDPAAVARGPDSADLAGTSILVIEDDPDSAFLLGEILRRHGATTEIVGTAAAALEAVRALRPDVLLSDITLPDKDGYALIREIRALGSDEGGWIPAIAMSGHVAPEDVKEAILAGFQLHLAKPVDPKDLVGRLARLVARTSRRT
jgi:signal transduction histidine kinase/CheY-like chemotaxis protein